MSNDLASIDIPTCGEEWIDLCLRITSLKHQLDIANQRLHILEPLNHKRVKRIAELEALLSKCNENSVLPSSDKT